MIESYATIHLSFPVSDQSKWNALVDGLNENQHGAYLEEYAESFGTSSENAVEALLDLWDEARGEMDTRGSQIESGKATIQLAGYGLVEPSIELLRAFLQACGAQDIRIDKILDTDYC